MSRALIATLRAQQMSIHTNARARLEEITDSTPEARAAEINTEFDRMMGEYDTIQARIDRLERLETIADSENRGDPRRPTPPGEGRGSEDAQPVTYRQAFHEYIRAQGQISDMRPEARTALMAGRTAIEQRAQTAGVTTAGGFTVPTELQAILVRSMVAWGPMYDEDICTQMNTESGNPLPIPTINDTARTLSVTAEGVTLPDTGAKDAVFGQKQLEAYMYNTEWLRISYELSQDSIFNMEQLIGSLLGEGLGRRANLELTVGDGTNDPNGIVTAASLGKTAASATAIAWDEILDLEHSVDPAYRTSPKARYMLHDNILLAIRKLKDGQGNYLWQAGNVQAGIPPTINNRPYSINQAMAATQATGARVMVFGDFSKYFVRKVGAPIVGAIQDKDFWPGFGMAGFIRLDGELVDTAAVKYLRNL